MVFVRDIVGLCMFVEEFFYEYRESCKVSVVYICSFWLIWNKIKFIKIFRDVMYSESKEKYFEREYVKCLKNKSNYEILVWELRIIIYC